MNGFLLLALLSAAVGIPAICAAAWIAGTREKNRRFYEAYNGLKQALTAAQGKYSRNLDALSRRGFHADRKIDVGNRHFFFDDAKGLTAFFACYFDDGFLRLTPQDFRSDSYEVGRLFQYPQSFCGELTVFPHVRIVECVLLRDGAAVKSSEGSAILAGTSVPTLGILQGKAVSAASERQTGLLSVRLTLDDRQTPSVLFHFTDGAIDKSSARYAAAFQEAQEVFGIFDAIARMNSKAAASAAVPASASAAAAPENTFEAIRQLGRLRDEGLLTEEEFAARKQALLAQFR